MTSSVKVTVDKSTLSGNPALLGTEFFEAILAVIRDPAFRDVPDDIKTATVRTLTAVLYADIAQRAARLIGEQPPSNKATVQ